MDVRSTVWLIVIARALVGTVFIVIAVQMVLWSRDELAIRAAKGKNGMQAEILTGQIRAGWRKVLRLSLLTIPSWLQLWSVANPATVITGRSVVINIFFTLLMAVDVYGLISQWLERDRLLWLARLYQQKDSLVTDDDGAEGK